jgi:hypothetical protein
MDAIRRPFCSSSISGLALPLCWTVGQSELVIFAAAASAAASSSLAVSRTANTTTSRRPHSNQTTKPSVCEESSEDGSFAGKYLNLRRSKFRETMQARKQIKILKNKYITNFRKRCKRFQIKILKNKYINLVKRYILSPTLTPPFGCRQLCDQTKL